MWWKNILVAGMPSNSPRSADNVAGATAPPMTRRRLLGITLSILALAGARRLTSAEPGTGQGSTSTMTDADFVLVDGWVLPAKYFRT